MKAYSQVIMIFMNTKKVGDLGEGIACTFLERKGFRIMGRNYRKAFGEVDIVAEKGNIVRFVEVKSVTREKDDDISRENGYRPEEQVHPRKLEKIARTAEAYMAEKGDRREYQIDVVAVFMVPRLKKARCRMMENVL